MISDLFLIPFLTGLGLAVLLPLLGCYLRLRDEVAARRDLPGDATEDRLVVDIPRQIAWGIHIGQIPCQNTGPVRPHIQGIGMDAKRAVK